MDIDMEEKILEGITQLMRQCGDIILHADRTRLGTSSKEGQGNFVTAYDKKIQNILKEGLADILPEALFVGEEQENSGDIDQGLVFIVDPIDGTMNFIRDLHCSGISVALIKDGKGYMGAVLNPYTDEMFTAIRGRGAFLNGHPIHVSDRSLEEGLFIWGTSSYLRELRGETVEVMTRYFDRVADIRRSGMASMDLCSIAAGRGEVYVELQIHPWDYAAGALIVEEAGGVVFSRGRQPVGYNGPSGIFAANREENLLT